MPKQETTNAKTPAAEPAAAEPAPKPKALPTLEGGGRVIDADGYPIGDDGLRLEGASPVSHSRKKAEEVGVPTEGTTLPTGSSIPQPTPSETAAPAAG